jgi:hypothetical protein
MTPDDGLWVGLSGGEADADPEAAAAREAETAHNVEIDRRRRLIVAAIQSAQTERGLDEVWEVAETWLAGEPMLDYVADVLARRRAQLRARGPFDISQHEKRADPLSAWEAMRAAERAARLDSGDPPP